MTTHDDSPDWPPVHSAWQLPEGKRRYGSTGQLWEVRGQQWVRIIEAEPPKAGSAAGK